MKIDGARLWDSLIRMAQLGATERGGVNRQTLTDLDREARDLFISWCREAGCRIRIDPTGNIFARRPGRLGGHRAVLAGSHLDTQPAGGKFDGAYGVLAGLEVVRTLNDRDQVTERPIEVVAWTNEEGCRFAPSMMGSGVFAGQFDPGRVAATTDAEGRRFGAELERIGYRGTDRVSIDEVAAYFELHIEQGPVLEQTGKTIGVVTGAQGQRWFDLIVTGQEAHAGTTPMENRRDALLGAARMSDRPRASARCVRDGGPARRAPELAQHDTRARGLQRGPAAPGGGPALLDAVRAGSRGGGHLLGGGSAREHGRDLAPVSAALRSRLHRCGTPGGRRGRVRCHGDRIRCRARRLPHR
ncbi:MAG: hydantoinase/carbamoylase family amidase, partial [Pseudomonadales bacterium]|nr:hydantoinase/carbamoylase family amidase [Pseudomonadales bacterium]